MRQIARAKDAQRLLQLVNRKHAGQIAGRIMQLTDDARPHEARHLSGALGYFCLTDSEYRAICTFDANADSIRCVDRRNSAQMYRKFDRR